MKKLAVIVPVYNVESYLEECIESVLKQSYRNLEIILVDDGSTDNSGKICDNYAKTDSRIHVIHQKNMGPILARYNGLISSNSDYITFVDGDDWIEPFAYEKMFPYMEKNNEVIMFHIIRYFDERNQIHSSINYMPGQYDKEAIRNILFPSMIWDIKKQVFGIDPSLCSKIIKREKLITEFENLKDLHIHYGEDVAVIYPLLMSIQSIAITNEYLYFHRQRKRDKIASYIIDNEYYKKLFFLYDYLKKRFGINRELNKQLDYFYIYSMELYLRIYGDRKSRRGYVFPFDIIPAQSKIIIYGAAEIGQIFFEQVRRINYCTVVAWVDRNYSNYQNLGVKNIELINECEYDYIVIAIGQKEIATQVKKDLKVMNVRDDKMVWSIR